MIEFDIVAKGDISQEEKPHAAERLAPLDRCVPMPVLGARVMLRREAAQARQLHAPGYCKRASLAAAWASTSPA